MYEFAVKRGGLSFNRIIFQQTAALRSGFSTLPLAQRLKVEYKVRRFEAGKEVERKYIKKITEAFPLNPIKK